jgi:hypothetical protein
VGDADCVSVVTFSVKRDLSSETQAGKHPTFFVSLCLSACVSLIEGLMNKASGFFIGRFCGHLSNEW